MAEESRRQQAARRAETKALNQAEKWLKSKEQECLNAITDGSFKPWVSMKGGKGVHGKGKGDGF